MITNEDKLDKEDEIFESIMMGLRMKKGISLEKYEKRFNIDLMDKYNDVILKHIEQKNLIVEDNFLKCSDQGFGLLNSILVDFME